LIGWVSRNVTSCGITKVPFLRRTSHRRFPSLRHSSTHGISTATQPAMNATSYGLVSKLMNDSSGRLEAITDNLANSATPGFRKSTAVQHSFDQILHEKMRPLSIKTDFAQGALRNTGNPTDFAITGKGFFVLDNNGQDVYTRNGQFTIGPEGTLVSNGGLNVKSDTGSITIPQDVDPRKITMNPDGVLMADGKQVAKLSIVDFADQQVLKKITPTMFQAPKDVTAEVVENPSVLNMALEGSNSSVFEEMVELIQCTRSFEQSQKTLKQQDDLESKAIATLSQ